MNKEKGIVITKVPTTAILLRARGGWRAEQLSDKELIDATKQALTANYMVRRNIEPKGCTWGNRHVLSQSGNPELVERLQKEIKSRGIAVVFWIEIESNISIDTLCIAG